jgi:16S rRNA C1402 N4-methylase RsmH
VCDAVQTVRLLRPGAMKPSAEEVRVNPRAESARLRAVEKLAVNE